VSIGGFPRAGRQQTKQADTHQGRERFHLRGVPGIGQVELIHSLCAPWCNVVADAASDW
jgi:hypothetical protein